MPRRHLPKNLGSKLKHIREHLGYTLDEMAEALGRTGSSRRSRIHDWENGNREPNLTVILAYAKLVGISTDVLIDDDIKLDINKTR